MARVRLIASSAGWAVCELELAFRRDESKQHLSLRRWLATEVIVSPARWTETRS